jgi:hypothetical protein
MENIWFQLLLGHLVGDYLLQAEWMAMNKSKNTLEGWYAAVIHCYIYTFAVCIFMWNLQPIWILAVFLSHFPIDKFSLGEKYMHYLKGKGMRDYVMKDLEDMETQGLIYAPRPPKHELNRYDMLEGGFTAVVYTLTDNTMHLVLMYLAYKIIY